MNMLPVAALAAVLVATALACAVTAVRPRRRSLAEVRSMLLGTTDARRPMMRGPVRDAEGRPADDPVPDRSITWPTLSRRIAATSVGERIRARLGSGLVLIDRTAVDVVSQLVVGTLLGLFTVVLCLASLIGLGVVPASPWWAVAALAFAPVCTWVLWSDVATRIERRRRELRHAITDFVQLTSVGLTTDQSVEEAVSFALAVGEGEMFDMLRRELEAAPARGVPLWEALDALGQLHVARELSELGASIERQGTQGVSITETVATIASSMRSKALDALERDADRANANLSGPTVGFVVATVVFLAYPLAIRISEAFGG